MPVLSDQNTSIPKTSDVMGDYNVRVSHHQMAPNVNGNRYQEYCVRHMDSKVRHEQEQESRFHWEQGETETLFKKHQESKTKKGSKCNNKHQQSDGAGSTNNQVKVKSETTSTSLGDINRVNPNMNIPQDRKREYPMSSGVGSCSSGITNTSTALSYSDSSSTYTTSTSFNATSSTGEENPAKKQRTEISVSIVSETNMPIGRTDLKVTTTIESNRGEEQPKSNQSGSSTHNLNVDIRQESEAKGSPLDGTNGQDVNLSQDFASLFEDAGLGAFAAGDDGGDKMDIIRMLDSQDDFDLSKLDNPASMEQILNQIINESEKELVEFTAPPPAPSGANAPLEKEPPNSTMSNIRPEQSQASYDLMMKAPPNQVVNQSGPLPSIHELKHSASNVAMQPQQQAPIHQRGMKLEMSENKVLPVACNNPLSVQPEMKPNVLQQQLQKTSYAPQSTCLNMGATSPQVLPKSNSLLQSSSPMSAVQQHNRSSLVTMIQNRVFNKVAPNQVSPSTNPQFSARQNQMSPQLAQILRGTQQQPQRLPTMQHIYETIRPGFGNNLSGQAMGGQPQHNMNNSTYGTPEMAKSMQLAQMKRHNQQQIISKLTDAQRKQLVQRRLQLQQQQQQQQHHHQMQQMRRPPPPYGQVGHPRGNFPNMQTNIRSTYSLSQMASGVQNLGSNQQNTMMNPSPVLRPGMTPNTNSQMLSQMRNVPGMGQLGDPVNSIAKQKLLMYQQARNAQKMLNLQGQRLLGQDHSFLGNQDISMFNRGQQAGLGRMGQRDPIGQFNANSHGRYGTASPQWGNQVIGQPNNSLPVQSQNLSQPSSSLLRLQGQQNSTMQALLNVQTTQSASTQSLNIQTSVRAQTMMGQQPTPQQPQGPQQSRVPSQQLSAPQQQHPPQQHPPPQQLPPPQQHPPLQQHPSQQVHPPQQPHPPRQPQPQPPQQHPSFQTMSAQSMMQQQQSRPLNQSMQMRSVSHLAMPSQNMMTNSQPLTSDPSLLPNNMGQSSSSAELDLIENILKEEQ